LWNDVYGSDAEVDHITAKRILIADDEPLYRQTTDELLRKVGFDCVCVSNGDDAIAALNSQYFDLVLSDLSMPGNFKMELLKEHSKRRSGTPIIVITGVPSLPTAIESIRLGITDYLLKPVKFEDLLVSVRAALEKAQRHRDVVGIDIVEHSTSKPTSPSNSMLGKSRPMLELFEIIDRLAQSDSNVLITGESGTGKEEVAQTIHRTSERRGGLFQVIDCTAIPESLFESTLFGHKKGAFTGATHDQIGLLGKCHGGTAFLDELGELPLPMQSKLLRAVQQQTFTPLGSNAVESVDTRFICATNRDLQLEVREGRFRQDLFYRLAVIHIHVPALRQRGDDILLLAEYFLKRLQHDRVRVHGFDDAAIDLLLHYSWPGNIRELQNVIERSLVLAKGQTITAKELPGIRDTATVYETASPIQRSVVTTTPSSTYSVASESLMSRDDTIRIAKRDYLLELLESLNGNVSEAARQAGLSRQWPHKLLRSHEIDACSFRRPRLVGGREDTRCVMKWHRLPSL
jgi:DNA-binding NtrC family response regulator